VILQLKLLILVNWKESGKWSFLHSLKGAVKNVDVLQPVSFTHPVSSRLTYIINYLSEFYVPLMAVLRKKRQDVVISWQIRLGICYGVLKRIAHSQKPPVHIIQDFHIDLTQNRWLYRFQLILLKLAIPGIDYFCCTSTEEEEIYSRMFNIPRDRIVFLPQVPPTIYFELPAQPPKDYIFSYGNSDRDFDTLIRAAATLNIKTVILSQRYRPNTPLPGNVCLIRNRISEKELTQWVISSRMVIVPLNDYRISAGQLSLLEAMSLGRPIVVTRNMATREYAVHRQTALFCEARDSRELAENIQYLWDHSETAEEIGRQARQACQKLKGERMVVFTHLLERCNAIIQKGGN
jgi:glycosyltransferase involved in cell wall biosynthesis